jgi:hypothetical protein
VNVFPGATLVQSNGFFARPFPTPDLVFSVIHTTAGLRTAEAEAAARVNAAVTSAVTATFFVNRDGSVVQLLGNPMYQAPWTNGVLQNPDVSNPRIAKVVRDKVNPNLRSLVTIENVSLEPGAPITPEQEKTNGEIVAWAHALARVPVSRETVIGHYQITAIDRPNCPARNKAVIDRIVAIAEGAMTPGTKLVGKPIGTFTFVGDHQLISPLDITVRYPRPSGSTFAVAAALDLKDANGKPIDVAGRQPPINNTDQVYLVDAPSFGIQAYALRQDGTFVPAPGGFTQKDIDDAVATAVADLNQNIDQAQAEASTP